MSARITPRPKSSGHGSALETAFGPHAHLVHHVLIEAKRAAGVWLEVDHLDVANDEDDPVPALELVAETLSFMRNDQDENGAAKFRITAHDKKGAKVFELVTGIDPPSTDDQRKTVEVNAIIEAYTQLTRHSSDQHKQYIELLKVSMTVPQTFVETIKSIPDNLKANTELYTYKSRALEMAFIDKREERESAERQEEERGRQENIRRMFDKLEPLAMGWLMKIMAESGIDPSAFVGGFPGAAPSTAPSSGEKVTQEPSKTATAIKVFCKSLTDDEKIAIIDKFSDDCLAVLFAAADAPTEQAAVACLKKLRELLKDRDAMSVIMAMRAIVGDRIVPLVPILKPIFEEKP